MKALEFGGHHMVVEEVDRLSGLEIDDLYIYQKDGVIINRGEAKAQGYKDVKTLKVVWFYIGHSSFENDVFNTYTKAAKALSQMVRYQRSLEKNI